MLATGAGCIQHSRHCPFYCARYLERDGCRRKIMPTRNHGCESCRAAALASARILAVSAQVNSGNDSSSVCNCAFQGSRKISIHSIKCRASCRVRHSARRRTCGGRNSDRCIEGIAGCIAVDMCG